MAPGEMRGVLLGIDGMTCSSCSGTVTRCLQGVSGTSSVSVVLTSNTARVAFDSSVCSSVALVDAVEAVGFGAVVLEESAFSSNSNLSSAASSIKNLIFTVEYVDAAVFNKHNFESAVRSLEGVVDVSLIGGPFEEAGGGGGGGERRSRRATGGFSLREFLAPFLPVDSNKSFDDDVQVKVTVDEDKGTGPRALKAISEAHGLVVRLNAMGSFLLSERLLRTQLRETQRYWDLFVFAALFTAPLVVISMAIPMDMSGQSMMLFDEKVADGLTVYELVLFVLCTPVQFLSGAKFHLKALQSFRSGDLGMDFMISSGTMAAYFYSLANVIRGLLAGKPVADTDLYFETAAVLIAVVLLGKFLEAYARGKTASSIHTLTSLRPKQARLLLLDEERTSGAAGGDGVAGEQLIDASLVQRGDILRLVAGETVPADGEVLSGHVGVDESMLTGESMLVERHATSQVIGGTMVVEGTATIRVTACGDASVLGTIISTIQSAQASKPRIQETADRVSAYFVPAIALVSVVTFFAWFGVAQAGSIPPEWFHSFGSPAEFAFFFALAVWVSACPCAFGLATPTAVIVATGIAAKQGLWIRRGAALQNAAELSALAFDKTGTLTEGRMAVTDCKYFAPGDNQGLDVRLLGVSAPPSSSSSSSPGLASASASALPRDLLRLVLALELRSAHPIARAVAQHCVALLHSVARSEARSSGLGGMGQGRGQGRGKGKGKTAHSSGERDVEYGLASDTDDDLEEIDVAVEDQEEERDGDMGMGVELPAWASPIDLDDDDVENVAGKGMRLRAAKSPDGQGQLQSQSFGEVLVGSSSWLREEGCELPAGAERSAEGMRRGGKVVIFVAWRGSVVLLLGLSDRVRKDAARTVAALERMGVAVYMVTGDNAVTAASIGSAVGISQSRILAGAKPEDKESFIAALQRRGLAVGFVGDGTNDSPALARANVGFALGGGTDLAIDAGDVIVYNNELPCIVTAIELSQATMRRIVINYFWALVYNCLLVPLAAGVLYPSLGFALQPMYAGAAMAASSVSVVLSSLCLLLFQSSVERAARSKAQAQAHGPSKDKGNHSHSKLSQQLSLAGDRDRGRAARGKLAEEEEEVELLCECPASSGETASSLAKVQDGVADAVGRKLRAMVRSAQGTSGGKCVAPDVASVLSELPLIGGQAGSASSNFWFEQAAGTSGSKKSAATDAKSLLLTDNSKLSCGCGRGNCRCGEGCGCGPK